MSEKAIGIIGKGMIGISEAVLFTGNGIPVIVLAKEAEKGLKRYRAYYQDLIAAGLVTEKQAEACERLLSFTESYEDLADVNIVFECVSENTEVKRQVYQKIEKHCPQLTAIASTTSALSPEELARGAAHPEKILVAHPINPPHMVLCVELVKNDFTSPEAQKVVTNLLKTCGREVCVLNKAVPGFIFNRLQHALYREAVHIVEEGVCAPETIDKCIGTAMAPRYTAIGLFDHFDYAGLDLAASIGEYLYPELCNDTGVSQYIAEHVERGDLGYKSGVGVYDWRCRDMDAFRKKTAEPFQKFFNWKLPEA